MANIKNTGMRRPATFDADLRDKWRIQRVTLAASPDVNPYEGGVPPSTDSILTIIKLSDSYIHIQWPTISGTAGSATKISWLQKIPSDCRPKTDFYQSVPILNGGSSAVGLLKIGSNGSLTISTAADGTFTNNGSCGVRAGSVIIDRC